MNKLLEIYDNMSNAWNKKNEEHNITNFYNFYLTTAMWEFNANLPSGIVLIGKAKSENGFEPEFLHLGEIKLFKDLPEDVVENINRILINFK